MGKNQGYKAMQRARVGSSSDAPNEIEDGMVDGSFHTPEWHAARLASLKTTHTITWEEYKNKQKEEELKQGELEADTDKLMREYRAQLDAERAMKLSKGRNFSSDKSKKDRKEKDHTDRKDRDSKKNKSKKRKHSRRGSSDSSSESSSSDEEESRRSRSSSKRSKRDKKHSESSSSSDEEESRRSRSSSKRSKRDKKHSSRSKHSSKSKEDADGPVPLSKFFGNLKS